jgi:CheY-like chemotaxis protein
MQSSSAKGESLLIPANQLVVLCIDDNDYGLKIRKLLLESRGFRVLTAAGGPAGLEIMMREHVDIIVLDYRMPDMDGEEVAMRLRTQHPRIPILLLSGFRGEIPESLFSIVDGFVEKGEPAPRLIAEVERLTRASLPDEDRRRA